MTAPAQLLQAWFEAGLGFIYPEICRLCEAERATRRDGYVCGQCWSQVRFIKPPFCERCGLPFAGEVTTSFECANCKEIELHFSSARSAVVARGVALEAVHRFKYRRQLWFEPFLAGLLLRAAVPVLRGQNWHLVVPVPLHSLKQREREFNQAARLARHLAGALKISLNTTLLRRVTPTATQTLLTRQQRADNMRGAFGVRPGRRLHGERVILVDDVFTTGATTSACAGALLAAGAADVCVWTVARGV